MYKLATFHPLVVANALPLFIIQDTHTHSQPIKTKIPRFIQNDGKLITSMQEVISPTNGSWKCAQLLALKKHCYISFFRETEETVWFRQQNVRLLRKKPMFLLSQENFGWLKIHSETFWISILFSPNYLIFIFSRFFWYILSKNNPGYNFLNLNRVAANNQRPEFLCCNIFG